jgi:hypothetical protein
MARKIDRESKTTRDKNTVPVASTLSKDPDRQRGFWSFLTWPFIFSELISAGLFFGKGAAAAQAADQSDEGGGHGANHSNPASDDSSSAAPNHVTTVDDVQHDEAPYNGHSPRSALNLDNLQFADNGIGLQPASNDAGGHASDGGGGGGGGGGGSDSGDSGSSGSSGSSGAVGANFPGGGGGGGGSDSGDSGSSGAVGANSSSDAVGANLPGADGSGIYLGAHGANFPGADGLGIDLGLQVNQLFGFDVGINADGIFVGVDTALWPDVNSGSLISDLTQGVGLGDVDLYRLLGFDVQLGSDGFFVVSDLGQTANLNAGLDLTGILLPHHQGSSSLIDLSPVTGLPGLNTTLGLADGGHQGSSSLIDPSPVTGLPGLGSGSIGGVNTTLGLADGGFGLFSGGARVPASVPSAAGGVDSIASDVLAGSPLSNASSLIQSLATSAGHSSDSAGLSEIAPAHVVGDAASVDALASNGDLSSGDTLNFPAGALPPVDDLFSGNRYTEYNMTLQAPSLDASKIGVAPISNAVDHAAVSPAPVDVTPLSQGTVPPPKAIADTNHPLDHTLTTTLDHTPTTTAELISHAI